MIRSVSRTPHPRNPYLEDVDGSWLGNWRIDSSLMLWIVMICDSRLVCTTSAFQPSSMCPKPPILKVPIWRRLMVSDQVDIMDHHDSFLICVPNFNSLASVEVCQGTPVLEVHIWRMLMVPDWKLGGWGHPWCHGLSWYVIFDMCSQFQRSSMFRSVSRTPNPKSPCLEDFVGS